MLDSEALSAIAERRRGMAERLEAARRGDHRVVIPTVVLAEVMTGGAGDARVWHLVRRIPVIELDAATAARAGALRSVADRSRRKKRDLTVDAIVAAVAIRVAPSVVLTSDVADLSALVEGEDVRVSHVG